MTGVQTCALPICADISSFNWDKTIGTNQVLEISLKEPVLRTFMVKTDAYEAYLRGDFNPEADSGTVTVTQINPAASIKGSFEAHYATDSLKGTFDATYCATGVEP